LWRYRGGLAFRRPDANNNGTLLELAQAMQVVQPEASGRAIAMVSWRDGFIKAFVEARSGFWRCCRFAILLWTAMRRLSDELVVLIPSLRRRRQQCDLAASGL
jgi:hypothetical protein